MKGISGGEQKRVEIFLYFILIDYPLGFYWIGISEESS